MQTYRAIQVAEPGRLELVERPMPQLQSGEVLLKVEACGVCGADSGAIEGVEKNVQYPRVPGHEVVGTIQAVGKGTETWFKVGQRVGVGRLGGHCNVCIQCRQGLFNLCRNQPAVGSSQDGGYAEYMVARATGLVAIPDDLNSIEAAPLLCAGIATFNALKKSQAQAGDTVVIQGIGGLGHLALQYARKMGFRVIAVGRGEDIAKDALLLGAHHYVDVQQMDPVAAIKALGGAQVILTTLTDSAASASLLPALLPLGKMVLVGVGKDLLAIAPGQMIGNEISVKGMITGTPYESERTLDFSLLTNIRARIETMPLELAEEAYQRMRSGKVKFRIVLTMNSTA